MKTFLHNVGKFILSLIGLAFAGWGATALGHLVGGSFTTRYLAPPPIQRHHMAIASPLAEYDSKTIWNELPHYPSSDTQPVKSILINNTSIQTKKFSTRTPAHQVIDYYLAQMAARGWRDITEDYYDIAPDKASCQGASVAQQDPRALQRYEWIRSTRAVLTKNNHSIYIDIRPETKGWHEVSLVATDTPNLRTFWNRTLANAAVQNKKTGPGAWIDISSGCRECNTPETTIYTGREAPAELAQIVARDMLSDGWRAESPWTSYSVPDEGSIILSKDGSLAYIGASRNRQTGQSDVMVMKMKE